MLDMNFKELIVKLQNLPEHSKKIILWIVVGVLALILGYFWIISSLNSLGKVGQNISQIKLPEIQTPATETPKIQTQNEQLSNWNTYTNTKYKFEIKYPADWSVREYDTGTGAAFFPKAKAGDNTTGNGSINIGFYSRGDAYCKIPFEDYVKIAGPSEIQNYESINTINSGVNSNGIPAYQISWNYADSQGVGKISLPIVYFTPNDDACGGIEAFLNDNNYSDIYNNIISSFNFTK
jgi:hypothetical protein